MSICLCGSLKEYQDCCKRLHEGELPENALALMRSRYTAYALCLPEYIIQTTHPQNPHYKSDRLKWQEEILLFCKNTLFKKLEILNFTDDKTEAYVTFVAYLQQQNKEIKLFEKSSFKILNGRWLYLSAKELNVS